MLFARIIWWPALIKKWDTGCLYDSRFGQSIKKTCVCQVTEVNNIMLEIWFEYIPCNQITQILCTANGLSKCNMVLKCCIVRIYIYVMSESYRSIPKVTFENIRVIDWRDSLAFIADKSLNCLVHSHTALNDWCIFSCHLCFKPFKYYFVMNFI